MIDTIGTILSHADDTVIVYDDSFSNLKQKAEDKL